MGFSLGHALAETFGHTARRQQTLSLPYNPILFSFFFLLDSIFRFLFSAFFPRFSPLRLFTSGENVLATTHTYILKTLVFVVPNYGTAYFPMSTLPNVKMSTN
jgi:hypothetical protein